MPNLLKKILSVLLIVSISISYVEVTGQISWEDNTIMPTERANAYLPVEEINISEDEKSVIQFSINDFIHSNQFLIYQGNQFNPKGVIPCKSFALMACTLRLIQPPDFLNW